MQNAVRREISIKVAEIHVSKRSGDFPSWVRNSNLIQATVVAYDICFSYLTEAAIAAGTMEEHFKRRSGKMVEMVKMTREKELNEMQINLVK